MSKFTYNPLTNKLDLVGGVDSTVNTRLDVIENTQLKIAYYAEITETSGSLSTPTGSTILLDQWANGVDAVLSEIVGEQPNYEVTGLVCTLDSAGNYTVSGTLPSTPSAFIYYLTINLKNYNNLDLSKVIEQVYIGGTIEPNELTEDFVIGQEANGNYTRYNINGEVRAVGEATQWDDLRVSANSTDALGSNPPIESLFKNDGLIIPGDEHALSFTSTSQGNLDIPDSALFDTSTDFTFEFWVRPVTNTQNVECVRKQNSFEIDFVGGDLIRLNLLGIGSTTGAIQYNRGNWNHILVQYDTTESEFRLYLNGQLNIDVTANTIVDTTTIIQFNRRETWYDVDYIAFWAKTLNATEISDRYNNGIGQQLLGYETNLVGLWEMNDGSGTNVVEKTGLSSAATINNGIEGVQWEWIDGLVGNSSFNSRGVILKYFSHETVNEVYFEVQMPHAWLQGSAIRPHVHFIANSDGGVGERVRWGLEYTWSKLGDIFPDTSIIYANENYPEEDLVKHKHYLSGFGEIDGTGKTLSSMLVCRLFRDASNVNDTYTDFAGLLEFDIHYQLDSWGSDTEFTKS